MPAPAFTARTFSATVQSRPWNAIFFPDRVLFDAATNVSGAFSSVDRAAALAELAIRYFLSRDNKFRLVLENEIGAERLRDFLDRCALCTQGRTRTEDLRRSFADSSDGMVAEWLCFRFHRLLSADGVIPVFGGSEREGFLLPFSFVGSVPLGSAPSVIDADDIPIDAWSAAMRHLPAPVGANVRVDAHLSAAAGWEPPVGSSLLLPVLAAWWRRERKLPSYDPLRLLFTGSFRGNVAECVETDAKADKVAACVKDGILFHPIPSNDPIGELQIHEGAFVDEVFRAVRLQAESIVDVPPELAMNRLRDYESEVRQDRFDDWQAILRRLEHLRANLDPDLDADAWLTALLLTSAANCHAGRTSAASEWNAKAVAFAGTSPVFEDRLLRALVEQLVILQDSEDLEGILALAPDLDARIERFVGGPVSSDHVPQAASDSALDLAMRFHGTMGQFHAYAAVSGALPDLCTAESASRHLQTAFACAKALHARAKTTDQKLGRAKDVAQDANYLVLYAALFDRAGLDAALERSLRLAERCGTAKGKNAPFALRFHALGLYRTVLRGNSVGEADLVRHRPFLDHPADAGTWWVPATTAKYLGAVLAASAVPGSRTADGVLSLFRFACEALPVGVPDVLRKIAMTVRAEAFRSLRHLFPDEAAGCLAEAKTLLEGVPDRDNRWKIWLESPDSAPFPGLSYWY